ncbi:MAG: dUTP diphosphatase [Cyanobacteria bacterium SIG32]|nr:dUTP diphosphatase [Cyanobacteria bacterium SIG32]
MTILKIERLEHNKNIPQYQTEGAAGMDLCAAIEEPVELKPLERKLIPTGLKIELEHGYEAQVRPRSGLSIKHGITLINCVGTIDEDYRGEVCVPLVNISNEAYTIQPQERIAQMVIARVEQAQIEVVTELTETVRGAGGFGSTGKN